ncbi:MAG: hypothetical protein J0I07_30385 [Myxococcales bacterium]|nr:hypothetical protein [Myxococcales bacterium]
MTMRRAMGMVSRDVLRGASAGLLVTVLLACSGGTSPGSTGNARSGSSTDASLHACSPLEGATQPIALEVVVGAGRHADGTLYVLDKAGSNHRVFVSEGGGLQRKKVAGSGEGEGSITVEVLETVPPFSLKVESTNGVPKRMGVFRGELNDKTFEIGGRGDVLELVDASAYASLPLRNIPGAAHVEYDASRSNGDRIVVTRPDTDWTYEDVRVFYGARARMVERPVVDVSRGSSTYITFMVDGVEHKATFQSSMSSSTNATLTADGEEEGLLVNYDDRGVGLSYFCL